MTFDYETELAKQEKFVDWLHEEIIDVEHHGCFDVADILRDRVAKEEEKLRQLRNLR